MSGVVTGTREPRVRPCTPADRDFLIGANRALARETEDHDLDPELLGAGIDALFADPERGTYWLAELDGRRAGCLMITREWSDWRNGFLWWIQSVYVVPEARGRGVYRALHRNARAAALAAGAAGLRLLVEPRNLRAQSTYRALGMVDAHYLAYEEIFPRR